MKDRVEALSSLLRAPLSVVLSDLPGLSLQGSVYSHPLLHTHHTVIAGHHVTSDTGTGIVHTAPAHGLDDFNICVYHNVIQVPGDEISASDGDIPRVAESLKPTRGTIGSTVAAFWTTEAKAWYAATVAGSVDAMARRNAPSGSPRRNHTSLSVRLAREEAGDFPRHPAVVHSNQTPRAEPTHPRIAESSFARSALSRKSK